MQRLQSATMLLPLLLLLLLSRSSQQTNILRYEPPASQPAAATGFNNTLGMLAAAISGAAYSPNPAACWRNAVPLTRSFGQLSNVTQVKIKCDSEGSPCSGFVGRLPAARIVLLSFSGTKSKAQLFIEFLSSLKDPTQPSPIGGKVQAYFYNAQRQLLKLLKPKLQKLLAASPKDRLLVTGHSLGAALGAISAGELAASAAATKRPLSLYTFGEPRTGDSAFAAALDAALPDRWRVVHGRDPVPHLPPCSKSKMKCQQRKGKPYHHGTEAFFPVGQDMRPGRGGRYKICKGKPENEDVTCSNDMKVWLPCVFQLSECIHAHRWYYGFYLPKWWPVQQCRLPNNWRL